MNLNKLMYQYCPRFVRNYLLKKQLNRLSEVEEMFLPAKMIPYESKLLALYDFSKSVFVEPVERFNLYNGHTARVNFKSSQVLLESVKKAYLPPYYDVVSKEVLRIREVPFVEYYANLESLLELKPLMQVIIRDAVAFNLYRKNRLSKDERDAFQKLDPIYEQRLANNILNHMMEDYIEILRITLLSNLEVNFE